MSVEKYWDLYTDFKNNYKESVEYIKDDFEDEPKTFNSISNDDDILQMYLKDVGRTKKKD